MESLILALGILGCSLYDCWYTSKHVRDDAADEMNPVVAAMIQKCGKLWGPMVGILPLTILATWVLWLFGQEKGLYLMFGIKLALLQLQLAAQAHRVK